jgi:hypothetical protein
MSRTQLQASGVSTLLPICIAYTETGHICGRPATVLDPQRGGMVCGVHAPKSRYQVTRSYLAKAEELLLQAAEQARKESSSTSLLDTAIEQARIGGIERVKILSLAVSARRLRCELEGGGQ